jgi:hypothetical protein
MFSLFIGTITTVLGRPVDRKSQIGTYGKEANVTDRKLKRETLKANYFFSRRLCEGDRSDVIGRIS